MVGLRTFYMSSLHTYSPMYSNLRGYSLIIGGSFSLGLVSGLLFNILGSRFRIRFNNYTNVVSCWNGTLKHFVQIESLALFILFYVLSDSFMFFSMSSNVIEAQKCSWTSGFRCIGINGRSLGNWIFTSFGLFVFLGNQVGFVLNSIGIFSYHSRMFTDILSLLWESNPQKDHEKGFFYFGIFPLNF